MGRFTFCCASILVLLAVLLQVLVTLEQRIVTRGVADREPGDCEAAMRNLVKTFSPDWVTVNISHHERLTGNLRPLAVRIVHEALDTFGFAILRGALPEDLVHSLRNDLLYHAKLGNASHRPGAFVHNARHRHHILLQPWIDLEVAKTLTNLGLQCSNDTGNASGILSEIVPRGAVITELASIIATPGAREQTLHPDITHKKRDSRMISAFLALQETDEDKGALLIKPGSHHCEPDSYDDDEDDFTWQLELPAGGIILMDSRTVHGGGKHYGRGKPGRVVFAMTYAEDPSRHLPAGSTYALRPELWGQMQVPLGPSASASCAPGFEQSPGTYTIRDIMEVRSLRCDADNFGGNALEELCEEDKDKKKDKKRDKDTNKRLCKILKECQGEGVRLLRCLAEKEPKYLLEASWDWLRCQKDALLAGKRWLDGRLAESLNLKSDYYVIDPE
eukprot:TRINITY_DN2404_c0_g1_i1.p1 TRINITY_DN2404_c0_g1~~TRINITY_DN2404_c0_g1_i1.p1  ORF type:complete len:447 (-),score=59.25 TRINITY_DN2404_c0_g1_i1:13-1353(-)